MLPEHDKHVEPLVEQVIQGEIHDSQFSVIVFCHFPEEQVNKQLVPSKKYVEIQLKQMEDVLQLLQGDTQLLHTPLPY